jgi:hypothetical protein
MRLKARDFGLGTLNGIAGRLDVPTIKVMLHIKWIIQIGQYLSHVIGGCRIVRFAHAIVDIGLFGLRLGLVRFQPHLLMSPACQRCRATIYLGLVAAIGSRRRHWTMRRRNAATRGQCFDVLAVFLPFALAIPKAG